MHVIALLLLSAAFVLHATGDDAVQQFSKDNLKFSVNVYKELFKAKKGNLLVSPISAEIILSLVAEGAKGDTRSELTQGVHISPNQRDAIKSITPALTKSEKDFKLLSANKIFAAKGFDIDKSYQDTAVKVYQSGIENVDFGDAAGTANLINKWVGEHTNDKIQELIKPEQLDKFTRLVLVNALYFAGKWSHPFERALTDKQKFHTSGTETKDVDMMHGQITANFWHCGFLKAKFLELPFEDGNVTMTFVLPDAQNGLAEDSLSDKFENYLSHDKFQRKLVDISIPKFTIREDINFVPILKELGVKKLFTDEAELGGISAKEGLTVSFVQQQVYIDVSESGVEAAAATAVGIAGLSMFVPPEKPVTFNADHPFLYVLKEKTHGTVLFVGSYQQ